jgi:sugar phosphate isomerase/epimerase
MAGLVFKAHHESTVTRAYYTSLQVPGIELYGGIALNEFVGGINPTAVGAALHQGARIVWGPTMHATHHVESLGKGTYGVGHMTLAPELASPGISVLDADGGLREEAREVIRLAKRFDATVATGHLGQDDVRALVLACEEEGARCLLTHVFFLDKSEEFLLEMGEHGALFEVSASVAFPLEHFMLRHHGGGMQLEAVARLVEAVGPERVAISSDCGQIHNATPVEALRSFLNAVKAVGVSEDDVHTMIRRTPRLVLGLPQDGDAA